MRPAYITAIRSARPATTARSWVIQISAVPSLGAELLHLGQDLRLDGHVERRGRLVGDEQGRAVQQRDGDGDALAHAAGELVRIGVQPLLGRGDADPAERFARAVAGGLRARRSRAPGWPRSSACRCAAPGSASSSDPGRSSRCGCRAACAAPPRAGRRGRAPRSGWSRRRCGRADRPGRGWRSR